MQAIELRRAEVRFERTYVYGVTGMPRAKHPEYYEIEPEVVSVHLCREVDLSPWLIDWVTLAGPRILKSGSVGVKFEQHHYTGRPIASDPHAPAGLTALVAKTLKVAEADRLGCTPPCPKCGEPLILADPARPEEMGEYCESCGCWFEVPLPFW